MKIVSINSGKASLIDFNDQKVKTGIVKEAIEGEAEITYEGLDGDTIIDVENHGGLDQALYLYHAEDYEWWSKQLGRKIGYGSFGENLTVSGFDDTNMMVGDRLKLGSTVIEISAPRIPCFKLASRMGDASFAKKFTQAKRPGAYARVIHPGKINVGDTIDIDKSIMDFATLQEVYTLWFSKEKPLDVLEKILESPIARIHKKKLLLWHQQALGDV